MIWKSVVAGALSAIAAFGITVNSVNSRPVNVGAAPAGEQSLQQILTGIYGAGAPNAATDQKQAAIFDEPGNPIQVITPVIQATFTAAGDSLGLFSGTDFFANIHTLELFKSTAANGSIATVVFNTDGTISIVAVGGTCATDINCQSHLATSGINQHSFGFYIGTNAFGSPATYYSSDVGNPNSSTAGATFPVGSPAEPTTQARVLTYQGAGNKWAIAFEDGVDFDYNDRVLTVESIMPVPEPAAVVLFGAVLVLCASLRRRRIS